jgi:hypothetical protein
MSKHLASRAQGLPNGTLPRLQRDSAIPKIHLAGSQTAWNLPRGDPEPRHPCSPADPTGHHPLRPPPTPSATPAPRTEPPGHHPRPSCASSRAPRPPPPVLLCQRPSPPATAPGPPVPAAAKVRPDPHPGPSPPSHPPSPPRDLQDPRGRQDGFGETNLVMDASSPNAICFGLG